MDPAVGKFPRGFISAALGGLSLVLVCGLFAYVVLSSLGPPRSWQNPPIYPGAQNVVVEDFGSSGKRTDAFNTYLNKVITFSIADEAGLVDVYYKNTFSTWRAEHSPDGLHFYKFGSGRSPTMYIVDVYAKPAPEGTGTEVRIEVLNFPGY